MALPLYFSDSRITNFELPVIGKDENFNIRTLTDKKDKFILLHFGCVELFQREAGERYRLEKLQSEDDVAIVWVYLHKTGEDIEKYALDAKFPMLHDPRSVIPRTFYLDRLPAVYLLAPDGRFAITDMHSILPQPVSALEEWKDGKVTEILDKATQVWEKEWSKKNQLINLKDRGFAVEKRYFNYGWTDDPKCLARPDAANALTEARYYLRHWNCFKNYNFLIWDAYRDYFTHIKMRESFRRRIRQSGKFADSKAVEEELNKYAAPAHRIFLKSGSHRQGGSVDLTIINDSGQKLEMGTDHDELSELACSKYFKDLFPRETYEREAHENRMLLREVMKHAGFSAYEREWWHFDYDAEN